MEQKLLQALEDSMYEGSSITPWFKGLLYGPDGVGKTITAAKVARKIETLPQNEGKKTLYWHIDPGGPDSFWNHPELEYGDKIKPMRYHGLSQIEALATAVKEKAGSFGGYHTIIVDTASNLHVLNLDTVAKERIKNKEGTRDPFNFMEDMLGVYNQATFIQRPSFLSLLLAPINIILIAHDRRWEDKQGGGRQYIMPAFTPEVYKSISRFCSVVAYMTAQIKTDPDKSHVPQYVRTIQFHPSGAIVAKSHIGNLPVQATNPNLAQIIYDWQEKGGVIESRPIPELGVDETFGLEG